MEFVEPQRPAEAELEISIFGTGDGESIALHLGHGAWGLVDACRDPESNDPVALAYLEHLGADLASVAFVLATHWHDDHVDGFTETLACCPQARVALSSAYTGTQFRAATLKAEGLNVSGLEEMLACFRLLEARPRNDSIQRIANRIVEDKRIWWNDDETVQFVAVAPTSAALDRADQDIAEKLLPGVARRRRLGRITPNQASVAAVLQTPVGCVLLGGDVEERHAGGSGWAAIVAQHKAMRRPRSKILKVPHHGSDNADHEGMWSELLEPNPISVVTPFASSRRPRRSDLRRLLDRSSAVFVCGAGAEAAASLEPRVQRAAAADSVTITTVGQMGHIRLRRGLDDVNGDWDIQTSGMAYQVDRSALLATPTQVTVQRGTRRRRRR